MSTVQTSAKLFRTSWTCGNFMGVNNYDKPLSHVSSLTLCLYLSLSPLPLAIFVACPCLYLNETQICIKGIKMHNYILIHSLFYLLFYFSRKNYDIFLYCCILTCLSIFCSVSFDILSHYF